MLIFPISQNFIISTQNFTNVKSKTFHFKTVHYAFKTLMQNCYKKRKLAQYTNIGLKIIATQKTIKLHHQHTHYDLINNSGFFMQIFVLIL